MMTDDDEEEQLLSIVDRWQALNAEIGNFDRMRANKDWLTAWAHMMEDAPPHNLFGNGLWFHNGYQGLVVRWPIQGGN